MTRFVNALLVFLMVLSAAAVYDMKYEAEIAAGTVTALEQKIEAERAEISMLKAEWSMLTQPARLQELVDRYQDILQLKPLAADHFGTLADIPEKPPVDPEALAPEEGEQRSASAASPAGPVDPADPADRPAETGLVQ